MAVTVTTDGVSVIGNRKNVHGTFTSAAGDSSVTISHGLAQVDYFDVQLEGVLNPATPKMVHSASASPPNTILTFQDTLGQSGRWMAVGI